MEQRDKENLYQLFRDHDHILGSSRTALVSMHAIIRSIQDLRCANEDFGDLLHELFDVVKNTEPKIIPLIHLIERVEEGMNSHLGKDIEESKAKAIKILKEQIVFYRNTLNQLSEYGTNHVQDDDVIILYSTSSVVTDVLLKAKRQQNKKFTVIMLKQEFVKTKELINRLSHARIEHFVISEYDLSHYVTTANKLFIGALSVSLDKQVICGIGTSSIVSLCHVCHIPVYLFVNSLKFSHAPMDKQNISEKKENMSEEDFSFHLTTHSHDHLPLEWIDHLVTEEGEILDENNLSV